jgi:hypothetical protein
LVTSNVINVQNDHHYHQRIAQNGVSWACVMEEKHFYTSLFDFPFSLVSSMNFVHWATEKPKLN